MKLMINEITSSVIVSLIITVLVYLNIPKNNLQNKTEHIKIVSKTFILSLFTTFIIFYFISDDKKPVCVYKNIIGGDPDF